MTESQLQQRAVQMLAEVLGGDARDQRLVHLWGQTTEDRETSRRISDHGINVLQRGADIVVFFDQTGQVTGWRDDGRKGGSAPVAQDPGAFRAAVVEELGLPPETRLGAVEPRILPPAGWTWQAVLIADEQIYKVWVDPADHKVIQCLWGEAAQS